MSSSSGKGNGEIKLYDEATLRLGILHTIIIIIIISILNQCNHHLKEKSQGGFNIDQVEESKSDGWAYWQGFKSYCKTNTDMVSKVDAKQPEELKTPWWSNFRCFVLWTNFQVFCIVNHPNNPQEFLSGGWDGAIHVWDAGSLKGCSEINSSPPTPPTMSSFVIF